MNQEEQKPTLESLKTYLLAIQEEFEDRNGRDYCKNCGMSFRELLSDIESIIEDSKTDLKSSLRAAIEKLHSEIIHQHDAVSAGVYQQACRDILALEELQ